MSDERKLEEEWKAKRIGKCRFAHFKSFTSCTCVVDGWGDDKVKEMTEDDCQNCTRYKCRYIEYPITVSEIENKKIEYDGGLYRKRGIGSLCAVRPCGSEYDGKTYMGLFLGELPMGIATSYNEETGKLTNSPFLNPAILVPELGKIIFGAESWWKSIESEEDFSDISDTDIDNTWYVALAKKLNGKEKE